VTSALTARSVSTWLGFRGPGLHPSQARLSSVGALQASSAEELQPAGEAELSFEPRTTGSAEEVMLVRRPGSNVAALTHCFVGLVSGRLDPDRLREALEWVIIRHPMLRARLRPPSSSGEPSMLRQGGDDGRWSWLPSTMSPAEIVEAAVEVSEAGTEFDSQWREDLQTAMQGSNFDPEVGPLWRLKLLRGESSTAMIFTFLHAADDQRSGNMLIHEILTHMTASERGQPLGPPEQLKMPKSIEEAFLGDGFEMGKLVDYAMAQAASGARPSVKLPSTLKAPEREQRKNWVLDPDQNPKSTHRPAVVPKKPAEGLAKNLLPELVDSDSSLSAQKRKTILTTRRIPAATLEKLRKRCRENGVTVTMGLVAFSLLATSDVSHDEKDFGYEEYRTLLGVDMRNVAPGGDWTDGTVAFASGALDFTIRMLPRSGQEFAAEQAGSVPRSPSGGVNVWDVARSAANYSRSWIERGWAAESTRLFDFGNRFVNMEEIITATSDDPATLGRAYSLTLSNAGIYAHGDGKYGSHQLEGIYFGISQALSGSLWSASWQTVNGELFLSAFSVEPIVERQQLEAFADSIVNSLELAAEKAAPEGRPGGSPRQNYMEDVRGGVPWYLPLETDKADMRCPEYEQIKSPTMPPFEVDKYTGIWYELAFHDITQPNMCGCTRFNMTRSGNVIEDMFTVNCPWPWRENLDGPWLPGYNAAGMRQLNLYTCNMTMFYRAASPGVMDEQGFGAVFPNMVLEVWRDPDMAAETGYEYTRALQFQCYDKKKSGQIIFTGINFLSRKPIVSPDMLQEMFNRARALGLEPYGSNDMHVVAHEGCRYPSSTHKSVIGEAYEYPFPVFGNGLGSNVMV